MSCQRSRTKVIFFITEDFYFWSHRLPLALAAKNKGLEVVLVTKVNDCEKKIKALGIRIVELRMQRRSLNPFAELRTIKSVYDIYKKERPNIVHHVAMKPILYGSIASYLTRVPFRINALAGMGYLFICSSLKARVLKIFVIQTFTILLKSMNSRLILQNSDDKELAIRSKLISSDKIRMIRGSGVDCQVFRPTNNSPEIPTIILPARILWDKGILEFIEAIRILQNQDFLARYVLVGDVDLHNPNSVSKHDIEIWQKEGIVEWWGKKEHMPEIYAQASIVCLPSYREGLPKSLLEAAACGLPIVTTDTPGCRDVVRHNVNGLLVPVKDSQALAKALRKLIKNPDLCKKLGSRGREIVLEKFTVQKVIRETMAVYDEYLESQQLSREPS